MPNAVKHKNKHKKKWPLWDGEEVVGRLPQRHFACVVQYPGDDNFYVEPRKMPSRKRCYEIMDRLGLEGKFAEDQA